MEGDSEPKSEPPPEQDKDEESSKTDIPVIPSALPLIMHNPATGQPPNTTVDSKPAPVKRTYQDMSYLIPPIVISASESSEKIRTQSPASTPQSKPGIPSPSSQRPKSRPTSLDTPQSAPNSFNSSSVSRSMIKNVVYNSVGTPVSQPLLYPQPPQMVRPSSASNPPSKQQPLVKRSSGYLPVNDTMNRPYPSYSSMSHGYDPYYQHIQMPAGMSPSGSTPFVPQQNRMVSSRPMNLMGYLPTGFQGRLDYPAPMGYAMYPPGPFYPSMMMPMDGKVIGTPSKPGGLPPGLPPEMPPMSQGVPQVIPPSIPQGISQGVPQGIPQGMTPNVPPGVSQTVPPSIMQGGMRPIMSTGQQPVQMPNSVDITPDTDSQKGTNRFLIPGIATDRDGNILPST